MLLTPRYDARPLIEIDARVAGPHPIAQQRDRLEALLADLGEDEWRHPSRCDAWTVQDVITHLISTNHFWVLSITQALAGDPTRFLATFDPVASPAELVDQSQGTPWEETLDAYRTSNAQLSDAVRGLSPSDWEAIGEAPPGHVPLHLVADHALWDCWVHERDIALPLGRAVVEDPAEIVTCLRYAAALGPAFGVAHGASGGGATVLDLTDPDVLVVVTIGEDHVHVDDGDAPAGARTVRLPAVPALEMLSRRDAGMPEPAEIGWLAAGLATVFEEDEVAEPA